MKGKELAVILGIAGVLILIIIIAGGNKNNEEGTNEQPGVAQQNNTEQYVEVKPDGTKVNTSEQLSKTKTIDGLEISNIRLTENGNVSKILADVKNPTTSVKGDFAIDITVLDKAGNEIAVIGGYIDKVQPGQTVEMNASATSSFANAYDFKVSRSE